MGDNSDAGQKAATNSAQNAAAAAAATVMTFPTVGMDDEVLFMEWAMDTLVHELPVAVVNDVHSGETSCFPSVQALRDVSHAPLVFPELDQLVAVVDAQAANSGSSGETNGSGSGGANFSSTAAMEHGVWPPSPSSARRAPTVNGGSTNLQPVMSWNFSGAASTRPGVDGTVDAAAATPYEPCPGVQEIVYGSQSTRRSSVRSAAKRGPASAPSSYAQDHIMAERKRREKINKRFIELSTVIPGLKKMDKATILSDATRHVKALQEKIKGLELETAGRSKDDVVLVKKPCYTTYAAPDENGSPPSSSSPRVIPAARNLLPEIEVRFSESGVMVRVLCEDAKGLVVRMMSEVEEGLHLGITHANVMPFTVSTVIITITAKVQDAFTVTAEEIVGRLNCIATT